MLNIKHLLYLTVLLMISPLATAEINTVPIELDRIVAVVNNNIITKTELDKELDTIKLQLLQQNIRMPPEETLRKQVLERLVINQIQLQLANANGIRVDDETLNNTISNIAAQNNLSLSGFRDALEKDGYDFASFRENIRKEIIMRRISQRNVDSRITVSEQEIDNFIANQKIQGNADDEYRLGHILIGLPETAGPDEIRATRQKAQDILGKLRDGADFSQVAVSVSEGQQALEGGDLGWRKAGELPSLFAEIVPDMNIGDVSDIIRSSSGFHIIKLLDYRGAKPHIVTQTLARHILIKPDELTSDEDAKRLLANIKQQVKNGDDFGKLAREYSDDKASAVNGGDLGWITPGKMIPDFEKVMDALKPGDISDPFKTRFGWHIVQVNDRRDIDDTEDFTRARIHELLFQRKVEEEQMNWLRRIRDEAYVEYRLDR
jgi:peptidyl-prolyl cis-trans isomerase SurA